ncbi:hypothetical protein PENSPDRAFT_280568 [Peniophora sp. CONT]|nr:hypothetical protein PENSPDRAFT_280568 [Peniophora sp. CONT]
MFTNIIRARDDRVYVRKFVAQMKTTARIEWWPNLARLQAAHYRVREDRVLNLLVHFWSDFGVACGLDEGKERRRHRREGRAFCSWAACKYSMQKPPGKLLSCRACGEAQYCGRDCQRKDRNQGGHKKHCGRRLKA